MIALPGHFMFVLSKLELGIKHNSGVVDENVDVGFGCENMIWISNNYMGETS